MTDAASSETEFEPAGDDTVLPYAVEPLDARGRIVRLGPLLDRLLGRHEYPSSVSRLLGEAVALTALLGTSLSFKGRFVLQTASDGPVSLLVVDFTTPSDIRAYARFDAWAVAAAEASGEAGPAELMGRGHLAMTIDQGGGRNRYQGVVALDGTTLEDAAHGYFAQSEQIPTRIRLAVAEMVDRGDDGVRRHRWRAGGVMVQFLPDSPERISARDLPPGDAPDDRPPDDALADVPEDDAWVEARSLVETIEDHELIDPSIGAERLLFRLFHERGVRVFAPHALTDHCGCSRDKVETMLRGFSAGDRAEMTVGGEIVVTCEFCSSRYHLDPNLFE